MVNLVLVSHSRALAEATRALARQVAAPQVHITVAAGIGGQRQELGTDATDIADAIQSADSPDGVLVLMDLGSAILSAELALDMLPDDKRARVRLCPAPLVEGAIAAAIQAGLVADLDTVYREAAQALHPKLEHLGSADAPVQPASTNAPATQTDTVSATVELINPHGLHARPAARFIQTAAGYDAVVTVKKAGSDAAPVSAKSLNKLATIGAGQGDAITISASGPQAAPALQALVKLTQSGFGEVAPPVNVYSPGAIPSAVPPDSAQVRAIPVSPGYAIGPLRRLHVSAVYTPQENRPVQAPLDEWARLNQAIKACAERIDRHTLQLSRGGDGKPAGIFTAHRLILDDESLIGRAHELISEAHQSAEVAWQTAIAEIAQAYHALPDAYLRERATDVMDVGAQVLAVLCGSESSIEFRFDEPVILLADDFTPAQIAQLDPHEVLAVVSVAGSASSHASILARSLGIPAVVDAGLSLDDVADGTLIGLDAGSGALWINPSDELVSGLTRKRAAWIANAQQLQRESQSLTVTRDGHRVEVAANLSGLADARLALQNGAEAVGVLRTEFLYLTRAEAPAEDEQVETLRQIAEVLQQRPVIVRTLDVGGDKVIPYLNLPVEANPYLGVRAIRLSLSQPALFTTQVRAILRAGVGHNLRLLLPMVSLVEELAQACDLIEQAHQALLSDGIAHAWPMPVGIMVETPSAALMAPALAAQADFFSIGTNDLTQYTLAAERGNPQVSYLSDALHPAVLRLIQQVTLAAHHKGKWAGVCGEIAADELAAPLLVGLDVDELSMNVASIPAIKATARRLDHRQACELALRALSARSAAEVREMVRRWYQSLNQSGEPPPP